MERETTRLVVYRVKMTYHYNSKVLLQQSVKIKKILFDPLRIP